MYYEEHFEDGKVWCRRDPEGEWEEVPWSHVWTHYKYTQALEVQARSRVQELEGQLPIGMEHCVITLHTCEKGHSWLSATNWRQTGCLHCRIERLQEELEKNLVRRHLWTSLAS